MSDLISRQDAIDKINERQRKLIYCFGFENDMVKIMDIAKSIVTAMPSVQSKIIYCKDCKYADEYCHCSYTTWWNSPNDFCSRAERKEE